MRKLTAILLWGIFLFNWVGYRALHEYLQQRATRRLEARLDQNQYQPEQLIRLKVPTTHLSYYATSNEFERIDGQIEINGIPYQYVARRIVNDSAEYLCIPDLASLNLRANRDAYYSLINDLRSPEKQQKGPRTAQDFFGDPFELPSPCTVGPPAITPAERTRFYLANIPTGISSPNDRPPAILA